MPKKSYALTQLKRLREWRDMTQEQLSEATGVKVSTIQKHERGVQRSADLAVAGPLADGLKVPIEALFSAAISSQLLQKKGAPHDSSAE